MPNPSHLSPDAVASREQVLEGVKEVVGEQMGIAADRIRAEDLLENDLGCDSLDQVEIMMEVEEHFGISVPDDVGDRVRTIGDVVDGVLELLGQRDSV